MKRFGSFNLYYDFTPLEAISYLCFDRDTAGVDVPKRAIIDRQIKIVAEVSVNQRKVDVFRWNESEEGWDHAKVAKHAGFANSYLYDGTLQDVLLEFGQRSYRFDIWPEEWSAYHLKGGEKTKEFVRAKPNVKPIERVSIDEIFEFA